MSGGMPRLDDVQIETLDRAIEEGHRQLAELRADLAEFLHRDKVPEDRLLAELRRRGASIRELRHDLIELVVLRGSRETP